MRGTDKNTSKRIDYRDYRITGTGVNEDGNHYCNREYPQAPGRWGYHYSSEDVSYFYRNPDGSKYFHDSQDYSKYTREDGSGWTKQRFPSPRPETTYVSNRRSSEATPSSSSSSTKYTPSSSSIAESKNLTHDLASKLSSITLEAQNDTVHSNKQPKVEGGAPHGARNDLAYQSGYDKGYDDGYKDGRNDR